MLPESHKVRSRRVAATAALSLAASLACAASQTKVTEEVIVEGTRLQIEERVNTFVTGITHRGYAVESLARWIEPVCPLVAGIPGDQGEFILQRVSQAVLAAKAPLASRRTCRPNFLVVLTAEPDQLLDLWRQRAPNLFGGETSTAVRHVMSKPRPVRAWYNVGWVCADLVRPATAGADRNFGLSSPLGGDCRLHDSHLAWSAVNGISSVIVLIDLDDIKEIKLGPLTDYIAMVGLTEVDLDGDWGDAPTILRLFAAAGDAASQKMSIWDRAFLKALYRTAQDARNQRSAIAQIMVRDFVKAAPPAQ